MQLSRKILFKFDLSSSLLSEYGIRLQERQHQNRKKPPELRTPEISSDYNLITHKIRTRRLNEAAVPVTF